MVCTKEGGGRGWGEEGGSGVKKMCTVQIRWCAPGVGGEVRVRGAERVEVESRSNKIEEVEAEVD
ncbi:hypothetical protein PMAC_003016 [Pneumocystis sp. 'macacae']|nr:hypothetical protein PMAC_003016 [Pneumocystis sp. 'macacae']